MFDSSLTRLSIEIDGWWFGTDIQNTLHSTVRITKTTREEISQRNLFSVGRQRADKGLYAHCRRQGSRSPCYYTFCSGGWLSHFELRQAGPTSLQTRLKLIFSSCPPQLSFRPLAVLLRRWGCLIGSYPFWRIIHSFTTPLSNPDALPHLRWFSDM